MNLLIVDDEPLELEQLIYLMQKIQPTWNIYTADDVVEAKKVLQQVKCPLALVDIQMPGESGLDFCEYLKRENIQTEVILVTAFEKFSYAQHAIRLHVFDYIVKPIIEKELQRVINDYTKQNTLLETKSRMVNEVLQYIHEEFHKKLSLTEMAGRVFVTSTYLSKKFSEEVGMSFSEYLNYYRIQKAKQWMKETPQLPFYEIAEKVGISTQHHFNHVFKKITGLTPSQFRELQR